MNHFNIFNLYKKFIRAVAEDQFVLKGDHLKHPPKQIPAEAVKRVNKQLRDYAHAGKIKAFKYDSTSNLTPKLSDPKFEEFRDADILSMDTRLELYRPPGYHSYNRHGQSHVPAYDNLDKAVAVFAPEHAFYFADPARSEEDMKAAKAAERPWFGKDGLPWVTYLDLELGKVRKFSVKFNPEKSKARVLDLTFEQSIHIHQYEVGGNEWVMQTHIFEKVDTVIPVCVTPCTREIIIHETEPKGKPFEKAVDELCVLLHDNGDFIDHISYQEDQAIVHTKRIHGFGMDFVIRRGKTDLLETTTLMFEDKRDSSVRYSGDTRDHIRFPSVNFTLCRYCKMDNTYTYFGSLKEPT